MMIFKTEIVIWGYDQMINQINSYKILLATSKALFPW